VFSTKVLEVLDNDSHGFSNPQSRPNLLVADATIQEDQQREFVGWSVVNTDENLPRLLRGQFNWTGVAIPPIIVQSTVSNTFESTHSGALGSITQAGGHVRIELGIMVPDAVAAGLHIQSTQVREDPGPPTWSDSLPSMFMTITSDGGGIEPTTPGHRRFSVAFDNGSQNLARMCRVTIGAG
jgi:hypothetical protein